MRAVRLAVLFAITFAFSHAFAAPSGYACPPGVPEKGVGCKCPTGYKSKIDDGVAVCVVGGGVRPPPPKLGYDQLLSKANSVADTDCKAAEAWFVKALQVKPNGIEALVGSGMCFIETKKFASAHSRFRSALAVNGRYEGALWGVAEAYRLQGKKDDAIAAYRQYLDIYPGSYKAKAALEKLQGRTGPAVVDDIKPTGRFPTRTSEINLSVSGTRWTLQGTEVSGSPMMNDFISILGKPDRLWNVAGAVNQVHTWDRLGVIAYEPLDNGSPTGKCVSLTMPFRPMAMDYDPKTNFAGTITVDGSRVTGTTTLASIQGRTGATQPYGANSVVFAKGGYNVFINNKSGSGTAAVDLVEMSLWKTPTPAPTSGSKATRTQDIRIAVTGTRVSMNGVDVPGKPMIYELEAVYGKPDRTWDQGAGNKVHTWDKLGLIGYEPRDNPGRLISATFPFKPMGVGYDPNTMFAGSITVDGNAMRASDTIASVKTRPGATQPYSGSSIVFDKGDIHVFTIGKGTGLDLVEISFWQKDTGAAPVKPTKPSRTTDVNVTITGTKVVMNGSTISGKPMVADLEAVFGKPDRTWETKGGVNKVHTWDKIGLLVYEPYDPGTTTGSGRCISATFPYKALGSDFDPKVMFGGNINVDGNAMTPSTTLGTVKKRPGATKPYGETSIVFDKGDIHVFTQADTDSANIELVEISFWQKDKPK